MKNSILRLPQVISVTSLSRATIYRLIHQGEFPRQIKLGERSSGWVQDEINQWLENRIHARDEHSKRTKNDSVYSNQ
ncbi:helix-turn-helix transcriptional regulator [Corynebacterium parakroppenstedtii]|uniref:helix-turn-helix transcriptional regulator n=1 Tax=Corynebacterium parakroppenstedtii TaxID=2828363 RepID=UPI001F40958A|nr:AlpA family transcriptional regulator [Corynebacterium parakroppenstedtii]MCF6764705.1 AlpA family transcriptional regulator [Thiotrichales bacterium 19S3-7]MCF6786119.1 AlpA family transcriptional regulator [Corynebacterium parakroppenstedtii]MCF6801115.1 AlpA family transcriptional regulator [Thiotrichales bacterium 19S3-11]